MKVKNSKKFKSQTLGGQTDKQNLKVKIHITLQSLGGGVEVGVEVGEFQSQQNPNNSQRALKGVEIFL